MISGPRGILQLVKGLMGLAILVHPCCGQSLQLRNDHLVAEFGPRGLEAITDRQSSSTVHLQRDEFALLIDQESFDSPGLPAPTIKQEQGGLAYYFEARGYSLRVFYEMHSGWNFLTKGLQIVEGPKATYTVKRIEPLRVALREKIEYAFAPKAYLPQFGPPRNDFRNRLATHDFGAFLRLEPGQSGLMMLVQNPFLDVVQTGQDASISYQPEMIWNKTWGPFASDLAIIGIYRQDASRIPSKMVYEWKVSTGVGPPDGAEVAEIQAFTDCVRQFLLHSSSNPITVEVGWTFNDYQIDVATPEGQAEYKRVMDSVSALGLRNLLYAPANNDLSKLADDADDWNWEHVLWLGLGQKIRSGTWDPAKSPIPESVTTMLDYAKSKHIGLLAYVYPSLPFAQDPSWLVSDPTKKQKNSYATLASREFQDFLIQQLLAFKHRTGISGYSFDYTFLSLPGRSSYSQWWGWRRVLETLRKSEPDIVIDGRQTYQMYGPWTWLAGSYPHPTGNDEQAESFTPYPDLHFDRVSGDRTRFVNYWYRNYQFAPQEVIPGYMTHQTPRNINVASSSGNQREYSETVYTSYRARDWDYLGFKYSVLSSIATGGWNHVFDMIPGRDPEEFKHFSEEDKSWIRHWLDWSETYKEYLRNTRTILDQPSMDHIDGTSSILNDEGFLFLFNPNYKSLPARLRLDTSIGLKAGDDFLVRELYPDETMLIGKPGTGAWNYGDEVELKLDGTSSTVFQIIPLSKLPREILVFGSKAADARKPAQATVENAVVHLVNVAGEPGTEQSIGVLLQDEIPLKAATVNGKPVEFTQKGRYVSAKVRFAGTAFAHSQEITLKSDSDGSLVGSFVIPDRILRQLARRREQWPIPWTKENYETTWLAPERLLLFVQFAEPDATTNVKMLLDGSPLVLKRGYASVRQHSASFVGFYADVSEVKPDSPHTIQLFLPKLDSAHFKGVFFDNVEPEYTEQLAP
jgi:hypothetical protein